MAYDVWSKIDGFSIEYLCTGRKLSNETLMGGIEPMVLGVSLNFEKNHEFPYLAQYGDYRVKFAAEIQSRKNYDWNKR